MKLLKQAEELGLRVQDKALIFKDGTRIENGRIIFPDGMRVPLISGRAGVLLNQGEDIALQAFVNKLAGQNLVLCLFKNDVTPGETDTEATYTEATFTGYSNVTLTGASWTATPGAPSQVTYAEQTFTSSADQTAQTIYGYYLKQTTSGKAVAAERFATPYVIQNNGDAIKITPKITLD